MPNIFHRHTPAVTAGGRSLHPLQRLGATQALSLPPVPAPLNHGTLGSNLIGPPSDLSRPPVLVTTLPAMLASRSHRFMV